MMMKWIILLSFVLHKAYRAWVRHLKDSYMDHELPENVRDVYDAEEYRKFRRYQAEGGKLNLLESIVSGAVLFVFLALDGYAALFRAFGGMNVYLQYLIVIAILSLALKLLSMPFGYYDTFVIEEKYGMNKSTRKTFFLDAVKELVVSIVFSFALCCLIMFLFSRFGNAAILWASVVVIALNLGLSVIIVPLMRLFNKFERLPDGELRDKLQALCDKYHVPIKKIVVRDASRRTTKANAFCRSEEHTSELQSRI